MAEKMFKEHRESLQDIHLESIRNLEAACEKVRKAKYDLHCANKSLHRERSVLRKAQQIFEAIQMSIRFGETFDYWETSNQNISELKADRDMKRKAYEKAKKEHAQASRYFNAVKTLLEAENS